MTHPPESPDPTETSSVPQEVRDAIAACEPHPFESPAPIGTPLCKALFSLTILEVDDDVASPPLGPSQYQPADDPVYFSVVFEVTRLTEAPALSQEQVAPQLVNTAGTMLYTVWNVEEGAIPGYGTVQLRADYQFDRTRATIDTVVLCVSFQSSPDESEGCGYFQ